MTSSPMEQPLIQSDQNIRDDQLSPRRPQYTSKDITENGNIQYFPRRIFWFIPTYTITLFLGGIALAISHYAYLSSLAGKDSLNQEWVNRFSLAFPALVKIFLTSALQVAVCQLVWRRLWKSKTGTSIDTINALFSMDTTIFSFFNVGTWRDALIATLLAVGIWLMNFIPVVAPSALSVGLVTSLDSFPHCTVPTLNITNDFPGQGLRLQRQDYTSITFSPSQAATDLVQSVAVSGLQATWPSPCGSNCSYMLQFEAPSLRCTSGASPYDPAANWTDGSGQTASAHPWWSGVGDGSNISASVLGDSDFEYSPAYEAYLNQNTSRFWVGISSPLGNHPADNATVSEFLNLTAFFCDIMNTTYDIHVSYINGQQAVNLIDLTYLNNITIPASIWQGLFHYSSYQDRISAAIAALYIPLYSLISGEIFRDPRSSFVISTNIAQIPALVREVNVDDAGKPTLLYIPDPGMLPHLEQLSHNMSLSLLANPQLAVTGNTTALCSTSRTNLVWKFNTVILIAVYLPAVVVVLIGLVLAGIAVVDNGIVRDKSFSTLGLLTTREPGLSQLVHGDKDGALPLSKHIGRTKLRFGEMDSTGTRRQGFVLK